MTEDTTKTGRGRKTLLKKLPALLWCFLGLYLLSYFILTLLGGYSEFLSRSGAIRYGFGMNAADIREWQPRGVIKYSGRCNFPGAMYAPLVDIDRRFWHKPMQIISFDQK